MDIQIGPNQTRVVVPGIFCILPEHEGRVNLYSADH